MTQLTRTGTCKIRSNHVYPDRRHYDLMNRLMTGGQDIRWRKRVIELAQLDDDSYLLDIGTGTGIWRVQL